MKKVILSLALLLSVPAFAQHHHHHGHGHWRPSHGGGWNWVAPAIIGGVIGYEISRQPQPVYVQPQSPVVIQQTLPPTVVQNQNCSPWTEIKNSDGTVTITRTCTQ